MGDFFMGARGARDLPTAHTSCIKLRPRELTAQSVLGSSPEPETADTRLGGTAYAGRGTRARGRGVRKSVCFRKYQEVSTRRPSHVRVNFDSPHV
jgi:hypothetical protein